jgi:hypothetical protein
MKIIKWLSLLIVLVTIVHAQPTVTQEQCQQADAQLNQVYQQLRGSLNDAQKQQLKLAQRDWIKKRDALVAANHGNSQRALYQATMQRVSELSGTINNYSILQNDATLNGGKDLSTSRATEQIEPAKQTWIHNPQQINNQSEKSDSKQVRLCPPASPPEGFDFGIIDESKERVYTVDNHIGINWSHQATLRAWDLHQGALLGEVRMPGGVVDVWCSDKYGIIKLLIGPLHPKDPSECGYCVIHPEQLQGICELNNGEYTKISEDPREGQLTDSQRADYNALIDYHLKKSQKDASQENNPKRILSDSPNYMLFKVGSIINKRSKKNIELGAVNQLAIPYAIAVDKTGSNLAIGSSQGVFQMFVHNLSFQCLAREWPLKIDAGYPRRTVKKWAVDQNGSIITALENQDFHQELYMISSNGFIKIGDTNTATVDPTGRVKMKKESCTIFNSDNESLIYGESSMPYTLEIIKGGQASTISTPGLEHPPFICAAESVTGDRLAIGIRGQGPSLGDYYGEIVQCDPKNFNIVDRWNGNPLLGITFLSFVPEEILPPKLTTVSINGLIQVVDPKSKNVLSNVQIRGAYGVRQDYPTDIKVNKIYQANENGGISIISRNKNDLKETEILYLFSNGGFFLSEKDGDFYLQRNVPPHLINYAIGKSVFPFEQFDLRLNRPDIVLDRLGAPKEAIEAAKSLREKRLKRMGVTEDMLQPDFHLPELQIVGDVPATTTKDQLDFQIKATDDKYPLDRLRVYVNNVLINGTEGESLRDQKTQSLERTIPIKLASGRNKIQVSVLNSAGAESLYANAEVNCTADRPKPKLYTVALGVSQYDRPEWCLKYAAKDATDLINKIKEKAGSSYSEVKPLLLTDKEVTKESAAKIKEFLSGATIDDTVLIFMAGHGILDDKYDYYFGTTDIDPAKPSERGMPYEAIDTILAEVPSLRKALLMDTCHAGELDDDEKKELATSDGKGTLPAASSIAADSAIKGTVAMRAIGTRGMTVKAVEGAKGKSDWYEKLQDMFVDLRRGSGATVISSSQGAEYAFESSEQSNGLFTYALMEALDGKATPNENGQITISTIGDYVKKRVQDLTKGKQNPNLRGVNLEEDFTLSSTK